MSDTPSPEPTSSPGAGNPLARRVGPFTIGQWLIIVGAGVALGVVLRRFGGGPADLADMPAVDESGAAYTGFTTQGAAVPMNGGTATLPTNAITDNQQWLAAGSRALLGIGGYGAGEIDTALRRYLDGELLTQRDAAIVSAALGAIGTPPEYVPPMNVQSSPTTNVPTTGGQATPPPPANVPVTPPPSTTSGPAGTVTQAGQEALWLATAAALRDKANASVNGGPAMTDAELDRMRGMGFTTSDPALDPTFRYYWRIWLNQRGYAGQNA